MQVETEDGEETLQAKALILCSGAEHAKLGIPGEEELAGAGVSYCATCDGAFFNGLDVAVAGGGDVAVEDAIFLARSCRKVYLIHRRDSLRAADVLQKAADLLAEIERIGLFATLEKGVFADIKRPLDGGKGLDGVTKKSDRYFNPFIEEMRKEVRA